MFVGILPFPTALLGRYGSQTWGIVPYAVCMIVLELLLTLMWWRSARRGLLLAAVEPLEVRVTLVRYLAAASVFAVSVPVAFLAPGYAAWIWLLLAVAPQLAGRTAGTSKKQNSPA
ncbi:putative membrane protein [Actinoplanes lutulentus]|uniref:Uncharacterized protein n=1 Tax=Actinoplanes lutulentus TaxID=1287878 RepID=A0A327ZJ03_9ACTN|nr:hypothetical protein [Actinoplanes lutulentus]MBB2944378.1 putative membrane protein [Actinoplanes lutulentus]RAK42390.1 hypothetical protein B0I29_102215 [Actinoplanes lutulentus]